MDFLNAYLHMKVTEIDGMVGETLSLRGLREFKSNNHILWLYQSVCSEYGGSVT